MNSQRHETSAWQDPFLWIQKLWLEASCLILKARFHPCLCLPCKNTSTNKQAIPGTVHILHIIVLRISLITFVYQREIISINISVYQREIISVNISLAFVYQREVISVNISLTMFIKQIISVNISPLHLFIKGRSLVLISHCLSKGDN